MVYTDMFFQHPSIISISEELFVEVSTVVESVSVTSLPSASVVVVVVVVLEVVVLLVDNFNGRSVISAGADQAQVSTYSFYIDAFMTLEYLSKNPKINIKKVGITGWSRGGMNSLGIAEKRIRDILINKDCT